MFILFLLSALGLVVSLAIHLSTFLPGCALETGQVWPLHICVFPLFFIAIRKLRNDGTLDKENSFVPADAPRWMRRMAAVFFVYAGVNFAMLFVHTRDGGPGMRDGKFVRQSHGRVISEITEAEYHQLQAYVARGFSGHWMLFYYAPMISFFAFWRRRARPTP